MKKLLLLAITGTFLISCGGGASVCKCLEEEAEYKEEYRNTESFEEMQAVEKKWEDKLQTCRELEESMSDEELQEEMKDCN